ncbi:MAG TPA: VWA domain-containing protein, partial [Herpetosiphonaceae bacterium]
LLAARGVRIDGLALEGAALDVRIESLRVPPALREGERYAADLVIVSSAPASINLRLTEDDAIIRNESRDIPAGRTVLSIRSRAGSRGFHRFEATVASARDAQPANNILSAWTVVGPRPRVLVIEQRPDSAAAFRDALEQADLVTEAVRPQQLPSSLSELGAYDAIVLHNIPAESLSLDQQLALQEFVRSLGGGLVAVGGPNSYSLGAYAGTPLEEVLPVSMEPPPRRERLSVTLLIILDRSASMLGRAGQDKLSLAKSAAIGAVDSLTPDDTIGILSFNDGTEWTVEFTQIGGPQSMTAIQDQIASIEGDGGTDIYEALALGMGELERQEAPVRHAVLLTDGRSSTPESYEALMNPLRAQGITLSTIAIGRDADIELLQSLAGLGAGRYHFAARPEELPLLTLQESEIARQNPLTEGEFRVNVQTPHPAIRGLVAAEVPALAGYVATTPKPGAEQLLHSPEGDTLMAAWQYGLGRSIAWTSDGGERWAASWQRWGGYGPFWAQAIAATFPEPQADPLRMAAVAQGDHALVTLDALDESGAPRDLADAGLRVVDPAGGETLARAQQVGPGRYEARIDTPLPGTYQVLAALEHQGERIEGRSGVTRGYSPELGVSPDRGLIEQLARLSGGRMLASLAERGDEPGAETYRPARRFWPWLVGAALLVWVLEIAWRRGWLAGRWPFAR